MSYCVNHKLPKLSSNVYAINYDDFEISQNYLLLSSCDKQKTSFSSAGTLFTVEVSCICIYQQIKLWILLEINLIVTI